MSERHVILICHSLATDGGSEAKMSWSWVSALAKLGVRLTVFYNGADPTAVEGPGDPPPGVELVDVRSRRIPRVVPVPVYTAIDYFIWQSKVRRLVKKRLRQGSVDLIHHLSWGSLNYGSLLADLDPPFVMGPIGGGTRFPIAYRQLVSTTWNYERLRNRLVESVAFNPFARFTMRKADLVIASNAETQHLIEHLGTTRVSLMMDDGVAEADLRPHPVAQQSEGPLRLLWVSRMLEFKALELSLDAVELAAKECDVVLDVLGDGPDRSRLANRLVDLSALGIVADHGWVDRQAMEDAFASSHVLLYNSLRDNGSAPLHEATRWGLPAIVLDHQGPAQITDDQWAVKIPLTTPQGSVDGLASAIVNLAEDVDARRRMGAAALRAGHCNTWGERARRLVELYDSITDDRPREDTGERRAPINGHPSKAVSGTGGGPMPRFAGQVVEPEA